MSETKGRSEEVIGKFYVNAYGNIGLILDYDCDTERCSWISTGGIQQDNSIVSFAAIKESIHCFYKIED